MRVIEKVLCSFLALLTFAMTGPWQALAQQETSTIVGSVVNNQKSPVPGIKILAKDPSGKILGEAVTDAEGNYHLKNLSIGQYQLSLDPLKSPFQGETVVTALGPQGLTVDWIVSKSAKAIASATLGIASSGHVAFGDIWAMAAATPGTAPTDPADPLGPTGRMVVAGVVASGGLGSLIWALTTRTRPHSGSK
ncbi:MAG: carboxypeptidase-like regulatory domain-containing protein [Deltaproteobacteria bacterium]|nr:carboxypeptidase-like regulatory domain-containing protein [Deltaproteobacteria bacterium]